MTPLSSRSVRFGSLADATARIECPLQSTERTSSGGRRMSAKCQWLTSGARSYLSIGARSGQCECLTEGRTVHDTEVDAACCHRRGRNQSPSRKSNVKSLCVKDIGIARGSARRVRPRRNGVMTSRPSTRAVAYLSRHCTAANKEKSTSGTPVASDGLAPV
jgi:hypothetical protein